jgi:nitrate reductase (cytochrome), electron transfer subunit
MTPGEDRQLPARVVGIGSAIVLMVAAIVVLGPVVMPPEASRPAAPDPQLTPAARPIAAEADVFRMRAAELAADPLATPRVEAHPRSVAMHRRLRAYPGAPPRIPHALTTEEVRGGHCNTCHERGGYVERFAAYAPVTPHPGFSQCLQCHVPDDRLVGLPFPHGDGEQVCAQCHVLDAPAPMFVALDWAAPAWPEPGQAALPGAPPAIPHELQLRGNCQACHAGPGAIEEIRTTHPERANCRQCHVAAARAEGFVRPGTGGGP